MPSGEGSEPRLKHKVMVGGKFRLRQVAQRANCNASFYEPLEIMILCMRFIVVHLPGLRCTIP